MQPTVVTSKASMRTTSHFPGMVSNEQFRRKSSTVLRTVAPTIALAAGGPFGPLAAAAVHAALGTEAMTRPLRRFAHGHP